MTISDELKRIDIYLFGIKLAFPQQTAGDRPMPEVYKKLFRLRLIIEACWNVMPAQFRYEIDKELSRIEKETKQ